MIADDHRSQESLKRRIAHDRPIAEKSFHIIADDR